MRVLVEKLNFASRRSKFIFAYIALSCAVLAIIASLVFKLKNGEIEDALNELQSIAQISEEALAAQVEAYDIVATTIAQEIEVNPKLLQSYPIEKLEYFKSHLSRFANVELRIVGADGWLAAGSGNAPRRSLSSQAAFQQILAANSDDLVITDPAIGAIRPNWLTTFSRRVRDSRDANSAKSLAFVLVSVEGITFSKLQEKLKLGPGTFMGVTSGSANQFAYFSLGGEKTFGHSYEAHPALKGLRVPPSGQDVVTLHKGADGVSRFIGSTRVRNYPMSVTVGQNYDYRLKSWRNAAISYLGSAVAVITGGFFVLLIYLRKSAQVIAQQMHLASSAKFVALGEMAASMAHEINNPLAIIKGRADMLRERVARLDGAQIDKAPYVTDVEKISATVERIARIIRGLRTFARNGDNDPMEPASVQQIVDETVELCRERFKNHGVELRVNLPEPFSINCRPAQISQVLLNLLSNAFDAVESKSSAWVEISARRNGEGMLELAVTDCGSGIPKDVVARMMEPFFTTKSFGRGTGLGLSISFGIIEMHGGRFEYDSASPHTRFVIYLPSLSPLARADNSRRSA